MKIKEIEERSGMSRANIRFYESEGLIAPARDTNGYRDYSEADLEILQRIKLLRTLRISLEEIKAVANGQHDLVEALDAHLLTLETEKLQVEQAQKLCRLMRDDNVQYASLDAQYYLEYLQSLSTQQSAVWKEDTLPKVKEPLRRIFARLFDFVFYAVVMLLVEQLVVNYQYLIGYRLYPIPVLLMIMLFVEPLFLCKWGTTPGKWVVGLSVRDYEDRKLSYEAALSRTWAMLWRNLLFYVPIYHLFHKNEYQNTVYYPWEQNTVLILRDRKRWRIGLYAALCVFFLLCSIVVPYFAVWPLHHGDLTVSEYASNYNRLSRYYYQSGTGKYLDNEGQWTKTPPVQTAHGYYDIKVDVSKYHNEYELQDGKITKITFTGTEEFRKLSGFVSEMRLAFRAFVGAQCGPFSKEFHDRVAQITEQGYDYEDFSFVIDNIQVICDVTYTGYSDIQNAVEIPGEEQSFTVCFTMEKL